MNILRHSALAVLMTALLLSAQSALAKDSNANLQLARQLDQAFVEIAEKVSPAVVVITAVQKVIVPQLVSGADDSFDDVLPPGFWRRFHEQFGPLTPEKTRSEGSGTIIRKNGYILTNRHVVESAESIEVRLRDGRVFPARMRGSDLQSDLAVIQIDASDLPVASLADSSKIRVGEFAIAIGAPFSLDYSVTFGHVSAKGRSNVLLGPESEVMDQDFIQTDANINPGNSGGPLVNINGEVIGINTLIRGLRTGIGFAVPSSLAKEVSDKLIAEGRFPRAWLGIGIRSYRDDPDFKAVVKGLDDGVIVTSILSDGPAAKSSLEVTDVITRVNGKRVGTPQQLRAEIRARKIGQSVALEVFRKGKIVAVKVPLGEWVAPAVTEARTSRAPAPEPDNHSLGLTVKELTGDPKARFGVGRSEGVLVASVEKGSPAAAHGLKAGDIITSLNQEPIISPDHFRDALRKADLKKGVLFNVVDRKSARFEILKEGEL